MTSRGFGRVLRALRKGKGLGLRELAKDADVPPGYLAELETGKKRNPSLDVLKHRYDTPRATSWSVNPGRPSTPYCSSARPSSERTTAGSIAHVIQVLAKLEEGVT